MKYTNKRRFKKGDYVFLKSDRHKILFAVYDVKESGYSLINVRAGIVLPNIISEKKLIRAIEGIDYSL